MSPLSRARQAWDLVLTGVCLAVALPVQLTGVDAVPANRPPDVVSALLTVAALAPLVLRRRAPLAVLIACFPGFLGLIAADYSVGAAPIGVLIAFYTVAVWGSHRASRIGIAVVAAGYAGALALDPVDLSVEGTLVQAALLVGGWVIGAGMRERRDAHAVQVAAARRDVEYERERAAVAATQAATEERLRITRELHDILGHAFSVMVVQAGVAEHLIDTSPDQARQALVELGSTGRASLAEMRRLLRVLREGDEAGAAPRDPAPTLADLPGLFARVEAAGLPVVYTVDGDPAAWPAGVELAAYRVIQEALTNAIKHAKGSRAEVTLTHAGDGLTVRVRDDGAGPAAPTVPVPPTAQPGHGPAGHGLPGMRERVAMYGGELAAGSTVDGYVVHATFPTSTPVGAA
jgi:signal transduction histidine kinase